MYYIKTFGCQMNHSDSERIAGFLELQKLKSTDDISKADLVVFNTCGVRQSAEDRIYGQIHNLRKNFPKIKIILTGCLANRKDVQRRLKNKVDLFLPIKDILKLKNWKLIENCNISKCDYLKIRPKYLNKFSAYVPIMTGCNNFCSYCVVPYARGREISRPVKEIINEVKNLVKKGHKEIILLGQNVNSYRYEIKNFKLRNLKLFENCKLKIKNSKTIINFPQILKLVNDIPGQFWISFISNHPKDFSDELIETATKLGKTCEYVHLPIQAGSDEILRKMNRRYTAKQYLALAEKIKKAFQKNKPGKLCAITSDIIVGFPGETKKQFLESAKIMEKVGYDMVYFGQFSPRPGTTAWNMKDNVSKKEKERREKYLNEILKKTTHEKNKKYTGKTVDVLVTSKKEDYYFGHTRTFKNIKIFSKEKDLIGRIARVKITKANIWNLEGKIAN